jgi:hypothetical protein
MAEFPAITPDQRSYSLGRIPTAEHVGASGIAYLSQVGTLAVGQTLELPYDNRPAAELSQIVDHHENQHGDPFTLPAAIWCGHAGGDAIADVSLRWIYAAAPEPEPARNNARFFRLTVSLQAVGVSIGPTVSGPVLSGGDAGSIIGAALPALPPRPTPVPDPDILPPTIVETLSPDGQLPAGEGIVEGAMEMRFSTHGLADPGEGIVEGVLEMTYTPPP